MSEATKKTMIRVQTSVFAVEDIKSWHRNGDGALVVVYALSQRTEQYAISTPSEAEDLDAFLATFFPIRKDFSVKENA